MTITVLHGDSRELLKGLADASIDSVVCDPPYALVSITKRWSGEGPPPREGVYRRSTAGFMGKAWDTGETAFDPAFWVEVRRVLKPGAHLLAFGGTRTYHRLVCAIEDAGFEVRDQLAWLFGSGFPKSHNQHGEWEGWGTALKPAQEPICLARKPLGSTVAECLSKHGTGALNIDASRVGGEASPSAAMRASGRVPSSCKPGEYGDGHAIQNRISPEQWLKEKPGEQLGRWPANVIHDGSPEVLAVFPDGGAAAPVRGSEASSPTCNVYGETKRVPGAFHADSGSAARFFYTPKADKLDRLESKHPTVKPVDLMAYLIKLVTPPKGVVLDPFAGSGSTGMAAMREGFDCILMEREAEYVADINRRLTHVHGDDLPLYAQTAPKDQADLFGGDA